MIAGAAARLFVATLGHDFDFDSCEIVVSLPNHWDIYATGRYNYAPGWFCILQGLNFLAGHNPVVFRYCVAGFLSLVDAGIFFILWQKFGKLAGCWFYLNPISIIISGYQNNFDNLAILTGLVAAFFIKDEFDKPLGSRALFGLGILGFSLILKHIFFAFPFWLAVKQRGIGQKLIIILIPVSMFFISFLPFWPGHKQDIINNVFLYHSLPRQYFYNMFLPEFVHYTAGAMTVWLFCLTIFAFIYRKKNVFESIFLYTCVMVAVSPATLNEYLAIPLCFVATHLNVFTVLYTVIGTLHELVDYNGLQLTFLGTKECIDVAIYILCLALAWVTWRQKIVDAAQKTLSWIAFEIENQLGLKK